MLNQKVDLRLFANIAIFIAKGAIVISAVGLPVMAISEHLDPWHHSSAARAKFSDTHYYVAIGSAGGAEQTEQTALLIPKTIALPKLVAVTVREGSATHRISYLGFWLVLALFIYGWYLVVIFIWRRIGAFREK